MQMHENSQASSLFKRSRACSVGLLSWQKRVLLQTEARSFDQVMLHPAHVRQRWARQSGVQDFLGARIQQGVGWA